jgi:cytochrome b6-f complex iron-sulfur subunit
MDTVEKPKPDLRTSSKETCPDRRRFFLSVGWGGLSALFAFSLLALVRFLRPSGEGYGGDAVSLGTLQDYRSPGVVTRWVSRHRLWVVHRDGRLYALEARCTHLGCTPRWMPDRGVFRCPCHGSRFTPEGVPVNGPAVRSLPRIAIAVERGEVVVEPSLRTSLEEGERDSRFFVSMGPGGA